MAYAPMFYKRPTFEEKARLKALLERQARERLNKSKATTSSIPWLSQRSRKVLTHG